MPLTISSPNLLSPNLSFHSPHITLNSLKHPLLSLNFPQNLQITAHKLSSLRRIDPPTCRKWRIGVYNSDATAERGDANKFNWDALLSIAEILCLVPSAVLSIGCMVNLSLLNSQKVVQLNRAFVWQIGLLVGAVLFGGLIRRRQWGRVCGAPLKSGVSKVDLVGRIEKLEEDLRSSTTIIRVLSRQLEKLGIRFRVTRKSLKEPISEAASLALKNSEATQALQMQKDILEKELGEIQKVLMAMQEQQQKQLELILTVAKAGKLTESKRQSNSVPTNKNEKQMGVPTKIEGRQKIPDKDAA